MAGFFEVEEIRNETNSRYPEFSDDVVSRVLSFIVYSSSLLRLRVQVMNAEQFKLPTELEARENLPFSWKWADERNQQESEAADNIYAKYCSVCSRASRGMPAVKCDFCPSMYHLDCLDPPLCEVPRVSTAPTAFSSKKHRRISLQDRWMCPNHVENFIDANLVSSTSLTERLKLWNKYAKTPVSTDSVRLEFFRKVRSGKLFQRGRVKVPLETRVKVRGKIDLPIIFPLIDYDQSLALGPPKCEGPIPFPTPRLPRGHPCRVHAQIH